VQREDERSPQAILPLNDAVQRVAAAQSPRVPVGAHLTFQHHLAEGLTELFPQL
jgi:predicted xylose isomerase-like sugar epimerase